MTAGAATEEQARTSTRPDRITLDADEIRTFDASRSAHRFPRDGISKWPLECRGSLGNPV
ncbi:hypothetical protein [Neoroseomonas lacus]|uniref:Uncharacterized protein n=1 Tax=Neoroseomonas lacus TaxID=287609 RepID=A0A917L5D9_9PROT|nr:hypothetical protein [Neoroseomonas lacus]GGJ43822.1 hypothetical protein GCM10011320_59190 [Neoroseomonas lacus]